MYVILPPQVLGRINRPLQDFLEDEEDEEKSESEPKWEKVRLQLSGMKFAIWSEFINDF